CARSLPRLPLLTYNVCDRAWMRLVQLGGRLRRGERRLLRQSVLDGQQGSVVTTFEGPFADDPSKGDTRTPHVKIGRRRCLSQPITPSSLRGRKRLARIMEAAAKLFLSEGYF